MIEDIREVVQGQPISARTFNTLLREVQRLANLQVEPPLEMLVGPGGNTITLAVDVKPFLVRISSSYNGQGVYKGYIVPPPIDQTVSGALDTDRNVVLGDADAGQSDQEEVIVWNAAERTPTGATGTNRTHILDADTFIPGGVFIGCAALPSSTNKARVMLVDHPGGGSSGATTDYLQDTADVGVFDTTNIHTSLATVFKYESVAASGTNHARADLKLIPSTAYYVVQMDSTATKLILAPCRGIP